tara:strand:+ start:187 stop:519 length:333 start_codon:yes stop_codon:yes gene_type:complete
MALLASAVGKTTVKSPAVDVLSPPKSKTTIDGLVTDKDVVFGVVLYISAPLAVMVAVEKVSSWKSVNAVVPDEVGSTFVNAPPPALYPVPLTSFEVVYAVVAASNDAEFV